MVATQARSVVRSWFIAQLPAPAEEASVSHLLGIHAVTIQQVFQQAFRWQKALIERAKRRSACSG